MGETEPLLDRDKTVKWGKEELLLDRGKTVSAGNRTAIGSRLSRNKHEVLEGCQLNLPIPRSGATGRPDPLLVLSCELASRSDNVQEVPIPSAFFISAGLNGLLKKSNGQVID